MSSPALTAVALALYLLAAVCYSAAFFLRVPAAPQATVPAVSNLPRFGRPLLLIGLIVQFAAIGAWCMTTRVTPFASEYGTLAVTAWTIVLAFAAMDIRNRWPALGAIALIMACVTLFIAFLHARGPVAEAGILANRVVSWHVMAILASFGLFFLAAGCAVLYLVQHRQLKSHAVGGLFRRLPPLASLDSLSYHAVVYALPLLTLGLILGIIKVFDASVGMSPTAWLTDPHTLMAFTAWFLYIFYLAARLAAGWRGVRLQYILLIGLLLTFALYFVPTSTHRFL
jgi:ABC-type transport system involved in cytochrome c biogenesis permease subunit